jgi:hypothetical protein
MTNDRDIERIESAGGAVVVGDVRLEDGTFIGRDQINNYYRRYVTQVFPPRVTDEVDLKHPYVGERPFQTKDRDIFTGRGAKIQSVVDQFDDPGNQTAVIYGPSDVGKTSLISAGVLPRLNGDGAEVVPLRDYRHAGPLLRALLHGRAVQLGADVAQNAASPDLARAILAATPARLVIVLDQFERLFLHDVGKSEQEMLRRDLGEILAAVEPQRLRILIAIRDDWHSELNRTWGDLLPGLRDMPVYLEPFDWGQAYEAIMRPVARVGRLPGLDKNFVKPQLLRDLDHLSQELPEKILPADLQIVCQRLRERAKEISEEQTIGSELYSKITDGKGALRLLDQYFRGLWAQIEAQRRPQAEHIAKKMLSMGWQTWVEPAQLATGGEPLVSIEATLDRMATAGLLVWHIAGDHRAYSFASNSTARAARRLVGPEAEKPLQAREELEYAWQDWIDDDRPAAVFQLHLIEDYAGDEALATEEALFLLRSAVTQRMPVGPWLARLEPVLEAVRRLEEPPAKTVGADGDLTALWNQNHVLGLDDEKLPAQRQSDEFGPVAWAAAAHDDPPCRETAVLALGSAYGTAALGRVRAAVREGQLGRGRLAELRGILADARDDVEDRLHREPLRDRFETWGWRFRRRLVRDWGYIGGVALGGAVGAGLALAALRLVLALLLRTGEGGRYFYNSFPMGFMLGGALSLGVLLVNAVRLRPQGSDPDAASPRPVVPAIVLGAAGFAAAHVLLLGLFSPRALVEQWLIPPLALAAGAGLSLAVHDQPAAHKTGASRWVLRLAAAAAALALVQGAFAAVQVRLDSARLGSGLMFAWAGDLYRVLLPNGLARWGLESAAAGVQENRIVFHYVAVADAALTGLALAAGLAIGMFRAGERYRERQSLVRRAGE